VCWLWYIPGTAPDSASPTLRTVPVDCPLAALDEYGSSGFSTRDISETSRGIDRGPELVLAGVAIDLWLWAIAISAREKGREAPRYIYASLRVFWWEGADDRWLGLADDATEQDYICVCRCADSVGGWLAPGGGDRS
jgi:hypothetical protein